MEGWLDQHCSRLCRSVSSSRSQGQAVNADTRSIRTMSTILDDGNQQDEADDASSLRSMSSTTSTNYAPRPRPHGRSLYTIPDEAAASEDNDNPDTHSQSEADAAQDLPASAAAQTLHQEADELMPSSQHASSSADSLPDMSLDPIQDVGQNADRTQKGLGSDGTSSASSRLSPVSEAESAGSGSASSANGYAGESLPLGQPSVPHVLEGQQPGLSNEQWGLDGANAEEHVSAMPIASALSASETASSPTLQPKLPDADSLHTPRAMSPPSTPGAPIVPKIDAGPALEPSAQLQAEEGEAATEENTMFAGLNMM